MLNIFFIFGAKYLIVFMLAFCAICFLKLSRKEQKKMIVLAVISLPIIFLLAKIGSVLYNDPRPFVIRNFTPLIPHGPDNGFPSDHALLAFSAAALFFLFRKKISYGLFILAAIVGISRVYVGVHHPIDIVGSFFIVILVVFCVKKMLQSSCFKGNKSPLT